MQGYDRGMKRAISALIFLTLAACAHAPRETPVAPDLQLLESAPLMLADGCRTSGSFIIAFTVDMQGRTTDIAPPEAPPCVREALAAWAASFRFAPRTSPAAGSIEWLLVTAPKGP